MRGVIVTIIVLIIVWALILWGEREECPRVIYGYHCKGKGCDHDPKLVSAAKWNTRRR